MPYYWPRFATPNSRKVSSVSYAISLADFKEWLKLDPTDVTQDNNLNNCLYGAVDWAQSFTRRTLFRSVWRSHLRWFTNVRLDIHPVDVSTIVVKYFDENNALQTLAASEYFIQENGEDEYLEIKFTGTLPSLYSRDEAVYIEYTAGYDPLPEAIRTAIMKYAASSFENRTDEISGSVSQIEMGSIQGLYFYKMML